jgi:hypothetical protein
MSNKTEYDKAAIAAAQILQTENGKILMEHLKNHTVYRTNLPSQAPDGQAMAILMGHLEGEKNLYWYLEQLILKGSNLR